MKYDDVKKRLIKCSNCGSWNMRYADYCNNCNSNLQNFCLKKRYCRK